MMLWALTAAVAQPGSPADLEGVWALRISVVTANEVPVVGSLRSTSRTWVRAVIRREGDDWVQDHRVCASAVSGGVVKSRLPSAFTRSVPRKTYPVDLEPCAGALSYRADLAVYTAGFDPACAKVPSDPEDRCTIDFEGDGHPGATIEVKVPLFDWAQVYVAQKNHLVLEGRTDGPDRIEGQIEVLDLENRVLGASKRIFARDPKSDLIPGASRFTMVRLHEDDGCGAVVATDFDP